MSRPNLLIAIDPDENDLGYARVRPVEPYPREYVALTVPLSWPSMAVVRVPARMTAPEFDALIGFLQVARAGLVAATETKPQPGATVGNRPDVATPRVAKATRGAKGAR